MGYKQTQMMDLNPFIPYAISEKSDEELRVDTCLFHVLAERINATFGASKDQMGAEAIFKTLDQDKDGFIGIEDVLSMNSELGTSLEEDQVREIMEQISQEGTKIDKHEFIQTFWR